MNSTNDAEGVHDRSWLHELVPPGSFTKGDYEYSGDRQALSVVQAVPGGTWLTRSVLNVLLKFNVADLLGTAVLVSEKQFGEIYETTVALSRVLGIETPPVYLKEDPSINAFTFGTDESNVYIVITRGLLDVVTPRELAFVLGHEMGHIKSRHVLYITTADWLACAGVFAGSVAIPLVGYLIEPVKLALLAWARRAEITADRAGLICSQDLMAAQRALAIITLGSKDLIKRISIEELIKQSPKDWPSWILESFKPHPYLPKRLKAISLFAESDFYARRILRNFDGFIPPEDLDRAVAQVLDDHETGAIGRESNSDDQARLAAMVAIAAAWEDGELSIRQEIVSHRRASSNRMTSA
jgi:Zn-dependent protease with chaperone function